MNNFLLKLSHRQGILLLLTLTALISGIVYWDFLVFSKLLLYKDIGSDTLNVYYPKYIHLADYLRNEGWPGWSFSQGMGQNIFPHSIGNPFELILILTGSENLIYGIAYVEVLKIFLAALLFFLFLRTLDLLPVTAVLGGLLYAFSGFMILGGTWYVFSVDAVYFALLLYALERYFKDGSWHYLVIGIALVAANTSFNLYLYAMFILPYTIFRHYHYHQWQPLELVKTIGWIIIFGALGACISAIFLIANIQEMISSPRLTGDASLFGQLLSQSPFQMAGIKHNITAISRLFSSDLLGTGSQFSGWYNYLEAPMLYCGLLALLLAPQVFVHLNRPQRISYLLFFIVFLLPVIFPFFRHLFWAFSGEYYRLFSAFVAFILLFFSLHAFNIIIKSGEINNRLLIATLITLLSLIAAPYLYDAQLAENIINEKMALMVCTFLLLYAFSIILLSKPKLNGIALTGLITLVCVELTSFSWQTINNRPTLTAEGYHAKTGYNDSSVEAIAKIKQKDSGFYRIEKSYSSGPAIHSSMNDSKVHGYFGTKSYHSFNQLNYIRFLDAMEIIDGTNENATRWAKGLKDTPLLLSLASVKYFITKDPEHLRILMNYGIQGIEKIGDVFIAINTLYLPLGFAYESVMTEDEFLRLPNGKKYVTLMRAAILTSTDQQAQPQLPSYPAEEIPSSYDINSFVADINQRRTATMTIKHFDNNHISGEIKLDAPRFLFFSIPFDKGWSLKVNGQTKNLVQANIGFSGIALGKGKHEIELTYKTPNLLIGAAISIISILIFIICAWRFSSYRTYKAAS